MEPQQKQHDDGIKTLRPMQKNGAIEEKSAYLQPTESDNGTYRTYWRKFSVLK